MSSNVKTNFLYFLYLLLGILLVAFLPPVLPLGVSYWADVIWKGTTSNSMLGCSLAFFVASMALHQFERFPQKKPVAFILPVSFSAFAFVLAILLIFRLNYSVQILIAGLFLTIILLGFQHVIGSRHRHLRLYVVALGEAARFENTEHYTFFFLNNPVLKDTKPDGIVADMHADAITPEWERFLSNCALKGIPVYNAMQLNEAITGKVNVRHLITNNFGDLAPSSVYQGLKRAVDIVFVLLASPVLIPLMLGLSIWIILDSPGGPFYVQSRMGLGGQWFNVVKFRSMYIHLQGSSFTEDGEDPRITRVGKIIRKYRLDELPQFWNVLKGEMSLIGPRPESAELAKWYDNEVPFFAYRHVVRPGISGWAQVMQGYAAGVDDMKDKLAYDFYYIKHFSLWLDLLIWYKTIKTVFTGFGSR